MQIRPREHIFLLTRYNLIEEKIQLARTDYLGVDLELFEEYYCSFVGFHHWVGRVVELMRYFLREIHLFMSLFTL